MTPGWKRMFSRGQQRLAVPELPIQPAQRRTAIAGNQTAGVQAGGAIQPGLFQQHAHQRLDAGQQDRRVEVGEAAFQRGGRVAETDVHPGSSLAVKRPELRRSTAILPCEAKLRTGSWPNSTEAAQRPLRRMDGAGATDLGILLRIMPTSKAVSARMPHTARNVSLRRDRCQRTGRRIVDPTVRLKRGRIHVDRADTRIVRGAPDGERSRSLDRVLSRRPGAAAGPPHSGPPGGVLLGADADKAMLGLWSIGTSPLRLRLHIAFDVALPQVFESVAALRARRHDAARSGDGTPIEEPIVLSWMPAASVYFDDPDGHSLEFISMLDEAPRPELGRVSWSEWRRRDMSDEVRVERRDGWRKLVLNRPDKLNAANEAMLHGAARRAGRCGGGPHLSRAAADRRGARLLRRAGAGAGGDAGSRWAARSRQGRRSAPPRGAPAAIACRCRWCAR